MTQAQKTLAFLTGKRIMNKNGCSMKPLTSICQFLWLVTLLAAMPSASHAQSAPDFKVYVALPNTNSVAVIDGFLSRLTGHASRPVRYLLPDLGGIDLSPIILIAIIILARYAIAIYVLPKLS